MRARTLNSTLAFFVITVTGLACSSSGQATPAATELAISSTATNPPPTESLQHQIIPVNLPENRSDHAGDYDSSKTAEEKKSNGGDRFSFERFERPFNANTMNTYFPELDIQDTLVYEDNTWIFGTVQVKDRSAATSSPYRFAMQIDTEVDGKGDYVVIASNPSSTDWTSEGVQVYFDTNSDVGDLTAMFTDEGSKSDGFETLIFNQGKGDDPDFAWVRVSPTDTNIVEFAIKRSVLGNSEKFMIDMWSGHDLLDAKLFDFSDHFTHEQAGAADPGLPNFYPIKAVYEIDNTCRMAVGFQPTGYEPGVCEQPVAKPGSSGPGACTSTPIQVLACGLNGGTWNSSNCTCTPPTPIPPPR